MKNHLNILILLVALIGFLGTYQCKKIKKQPEGLTVNSQCIDAFANLRAQMYQAVTFKIVNNEIVVGEIFNSGDIEFEQLVDRLSNSEPIYILYYISERQRYIMINFKPSNTTIRDRMLYSLSFQTLKSQLPGISQVFDCSEKSGLLEEYQGYLQKTK